jgi:aminoglycoside phosphotransferase (APT) family kinase protein
VFDVLPDGLVLERVDGATMHETVTRNPSGGALARSAVELAALHDAVHSVTLDGAALTHGDLHWKNVIESPHGPVMLDWANAGWGSADVDVALTWVILATSGGDLGRMLAERFADVVDTTTARRQAAARRLADRGLSSTERRAVTALLG